jgi:hypothetical protein
MRVYHIHDNGGRPFIVHITDAPTLHLRVFTTRQKTDGEIICNREVYNTDATCVFLDDETNGGFDPRFYGNTILAEIANRRYVWIGNRGIREFTARAPIIQFTSPVGNSNVPYPWARDAIGDYYLMLHDVVIRNRDSNQLRADPYAYYYTNNVINIGTNSILAGYQHVEAYGCGTEQYDLRHSTDYDWIRARHERRDWWIVKGTGMQIPLSADDEIQLMEAAGKYAGYSKLDMVEVHARP